MTIKIYDRIAKTLIALPALITLTLAALGYFN